MRRYLTFALVAAGLSVVVTTWIAPHLLGWWFTPPVPVPISCTESVAWATSRLVEMQLWGLGLGALVGIALCFWWARRQAKKTAEPSAKPPAPPAAPAKT